jgi:MerR family transcriptional regulator, light-induced transcriptional regulator
LPNDTLAPAAEAFLEATLLGRREAALRVARDVAADLSLMNVYVDVVEAAQRELGRRWARAEVSIADEHRATAVTQYVLAVLYAEQARPPVTAGGSAVVCAVEGNQHQLGAHVIADALDQHGWSVDFLGADVPHDGVVAAVRKDAPDLLAISVALPRQVDAAGDLIERVRFTHAGRGVAILVGGGGITGNEWRWIGADGCGGDVHAGLALARELTQPA